MLIAHDKISVIRAFIDFLMEVTGVPLSAFHVFGHSAGAHVAGAIGLGFRERHSFTKVLPRVTGDCPLEIKKLLGYLKILCHVYCKQVSIQPISFQIWVSLTTTLIQPMPNKWTLFTLMKSWAFYSLLERSISLLLEAKINQIVLKEKV